MRIRMIGRVLFLSFFVSVWSQSQTGVKPGPCPDFKGMDNFDTRADGEWFTVYTSTNFPKKTRCSKGFYTTKAPGTVFGQLAFYEVGNPTLQKPNATYNAVPGKTSTFKVDAHRPEGQTQSPEFENIQEIFGTILDTDYDNYFVSIKCANLDSNKHRECTEVSSRKPTISDEALTKAKEAITRAGFDATDLVKHDQTDCTY